MRAISAPRRRLTRRRSAATRPERLVHRGQDLLRPDGAELWYTFCGPVEVLGEEARGLHVVQREDGVVLAALLRKNPSWENHACPGMLFLGDHHDGLDVIYHDRRRAYHGAALPPRIVERGPFEGPTFGQLVARRARIYWVVVDRRTGPTCEEWQLAPPGRQPRSTGISLGCGARHRVVANTGGALTMHTDPPDMGGRIRAYDPGDTERWYTDRARCQRDAESRRRQVALAFQPHQGS